MNNQKGRMIPNLLTVIILIAPTSFGQDNPQSQNPQSEARVGVNPSKRVTLTLRDAMTMALENNRDIEVERLNVQMNEFDLRASQGVYDPTLAATFFYERRSIPATSIFAAGKTDNLIGTATLTQRMPW
ncbi:MAG TPA: TolC family protein, partial [Blastocatellia bacterium]|nr:TolC family protein [Blastocatellia bacterium]